MNRDPKLMSEEELEQFRAEQNAKLKEVDTVQAQSLMVNCLTDFGDSIVFGPVDKFREMVVTFDYYGKSEEIHIGNVEAVSIINHLKEQFGL